MREERKGEIVKKLEEGLNDNSIINKHFCLLEVFRMLKEDKVIPEGNYNSLAEDTGDTMLGM